MSSEAGAQRSCNQRQGQAGHAPVIKPAKDVNEDVYVYEYELPDRRPRHVQLPGYAYGAVAHGVWGPAAAKLRRRNGKPASGSMMVSKEYRW